MSGFHVVAHSRSAEIALRSGPHRNLGEAQVSARRMAQRPDIQDAHVVYNGRVVWVAENRRNNPDRRSLKAYREGFRAGRLDRSMGVVVTGNLTDARDESAPAYFRWYGQGYRDGVYNLKQQFTAPAPSIPQRRDNPRFLSSDAMLRAVAGALRRCGCRYGLQVVSGRIRIAVATEKALRKATEALARFGVEYNVISKGRLTVIVVGRSRNVKRRAATRLRRSNPSRSRRGSDRWVGNSRTGWRRFFVGRHYLAVVRHKPYSIMWEVRVSPSRPSAGGVIYSDMAFTPEKARHLANEFVRSLSH